MISLGQQVATGAAWMVLLRVVDRLVGIISVSVLARLLLPEHFGVVALASSLVGLIEAMSDFGIDLALIRAQQPDRRLYDTAWTIRILRAVALGLVLVTVARPVASSRSILRRASTFAHKVTGTLARPSVVQGQCARSRTNAAPWPSSRKPSAAPLASSVLVGSPSTLTS